MRRSFRTLAALLALLTFRFVAMADTSVTNPPVHWLTWAALKQKWGAVSLADLQRAVAGGDLTAEQYLGRCYTEGFRFPQNSALGVDYYERAGQAGYLPAWNNLGVLYEQGQGVPQDMTKAVNYFRLAADAGFADSMANLGSLYNDGNGVDRDSQEALKWLRRAADRGNWGAMVSLYQIYYDGRGVEPDPKEGLKWLTMAAEDGDAYGQCLLGYFYATPRQDNARSPIVMPNMEKAIFWYDRSAAQNWAGGQYQLGCCCLTGDGVEQDEARGLDLIRQAADQNHAYAMIKLADLYAKGIGEPRNDQDRPTPLLLRVAANGPRKAVEDACHKLGFRYEHGIGTERDIITAIQWACRKAVISNDTLIDMVEVKPPIHVPGGAFAGDDTGRNSVYIYSPNGGRPSVEFVMALSQYLKSAQSDTHEGLLPIGDRYLSGQDVPVSPEKAWLWFSLAAEKNVPGAAARVAVAEARMSAGDLTEVKKLLPGMVSDFDKVADLLRTQSLRQTSQPNPNNP